MEFQVCYEAEAKINPESKVFTENLNSINLLFTSL